MDVINLRQQIVLFGNYDDVVPSVDVIKYFIDTLGDKNLIPNQFKEINVRVNDDGRTANNTEYTRLRLTSGDERWNVRFNLERLEFMLTNTNIGKVEMLQLDEFINEFMEIQNIINQKFPKSLKRIGVVSQYLITGVNANDISKKINRTIDYLNNKPIVESINKVVGRTTLNIPKSEIINISTEFRWARTNLRMDNKNMLVDGMILTIDINTLNENQEYRFDIQKLELAVKEICQVSKLVQKQSLESLV